MALDRISIPDGAPFVKVTRTINRPLQETFDYIINVDLTHIFPLIGNVPGVVSTTIDKEWGKAGMERVNTLTDGSSSREKMLTVDAPRSFTYRIESFTAPVLKPLLDHIEGGWILTDNGNGTTSIEWIYCLVPLNAQAKTQVEQALLTRYQVRLESAMTIIKDDLEQDSTTSPRTR